MTATAGKGWVRMRMDALTINAVDAAGRAVMSEVTREHLAGLKIAHDVLSAMTSKQVSDEACMEIERLAMQASAAPEQEPVDFGWQHWRAGDTVRYTADEDFVHARMTVGSDYLIHESPDEFETMLVLDDDGDELGVLVGEFEFVSRADTHSDPSEVAQLRADKQYLQRTIDGMNEKHGEVVWQMSEAAKRADAAERKLGEAVGLLREITEDPRLVVAMKSAHLSAIRLLLSASAEPAGQNFSGCSATDRAEIGVVFAEPAKGGDGEGQP